MTLMIRAAIVSTAAFFVSPPAIVTDASAELAVLA
jgi:hypothetical protein